MSSVEEETGTTSQDMIENSTMSNNEHNISGGNNQVSDKSIYSSDRTSTPESIEQPSHSGNTSFSQNTAECLNPLNRDGDLNCSSDTSRVPVNDQQSSHSINTSLSQNMNEHFISEISNIRSDSNAISSNVDQPNSSVNTSLSQSLAEHLKMLFNGETLNTSSGPNTTPTKVERPNQSVNTSLSQSLAEHLQMLFSGEALNTNSGSLTTPTSVEQPNQSLNTSLSQSLAEQLSKLFIGEILNTSSGPNTTPASVEQPNQSVNTSLSQSLAEHLQMLFSGEALHTNSGSLTTPTSVEQTSQSVNTSLSQSLAEQLSMLFIGEILNTSSGPNTTPTSVEQSNHAINTSLSQSLSEHLQMLFSGEISNASSGPSTTPSIEEPNHSVNTSLSQSLAEHLINLVHGGGRSRLSSDPDLMRPNVDQPKSPINTSRSQSTTESLNLMFGEDYVLNCSSNINSSSASVEQNSHLNDLSLPQSSFNKSQSQNLMNKHSNDHGGEELNKMTASNLQECFDSSLSVGIATEVTSYNEMESTLGIRSIFSSTLNESAINSSNLQVSYLQNESLHSNFQSENNISLSPNISKSVDTSILDPVDPLKSCTTPESLEKCTDDSTLKLTITFNKSQNDAVYKKSNSDDLPQNSDVCNESLKIVDKTGSILSEMADQVCINKSTSDNFMHEAVILKENSECVKRNNNHESELFSATEATNERKEDSNEKSRIIEKMERSFNEGSKGIPHIFKNSLNDLSLNSSSNEVESFYCHSGSRSSNSLHNTSDNLLSCGKVTVDSSIPTVPKSDLVKNGSDPIECSNNSVTGDHLRIPNSSVVQNFLIPQNSLKQSPVFSCGRTSENMDETCLVDQLCEKLIINMEETCISSCQERDEPGTLHDQIAVKETSHNKSVKSLAHCDYSAGRVSLDPGVSKNDASLTGSSLNPEASLTETSLIPEVLVKGESISPAVSYTRKLINPQNSLLRESLNPEISLTEESFNPEVSLTGLSLNTDVSLTGVSLVSDVSLTGVTLNLEDSLTETSLKPHISLTRESINPEVSLKNVSINPSALLNREPINPEVSMTRESFNTQNLILGKSCDPQVLPMEESFNPEISQVGASPILDVSVTKASLNPRASRISDLDMSQAEEETSISGNILDSTTAVLEANESIRLMDQSYPKVTFHQEGISLEKFIPSNVTLIQNDGHEYTQNMDITMFAQPNETADNYEYSLDFTCKPEATIISDETIIMSQSVIEYDNLKCKQPSPPGTRDKSFIRNAESAVCENVNTGHSEKHDPEELHSCSADLDGSVGLAMDDSVGLAMDYSLSVSDCTGLLADSSIVEARRSTSGPAVTNTSLTNKMEGLDLSLTSGMAMDPRRVSVDMSSTFKPRGIDMSYHQNETSFMHIIDKNSDMRRMLSESINKSICLGKKIPSEDVMSMKENLFLIMDLLEKENNEFEAYKKACESEKQELLMKIDDLQSQVSAKNDNEQMKDEMASVLDNLQKKESELSALMCRCKEVEIYLNKSQTDLDNLRKMLLLNDSDLIGIREMSSYLDSLNINTEGMITENNGFTIQPKKILNVLSLLVTKYHTFVNDYNNLLQNYEQDKVRYQLFQEEIYKSGNEQSSKIASLEQECERLQFALQENIKQCKLLEETNVSLSTTLTFKENEILKFQSEIKSMADEMKRDKVVISELERKYSDIQVNLIEMEKLNEDLKTKLEEKTFAYIEASESCENKKLEAEGLASDIVSLKEELFALKDCYNAVCSQLNKRDEQLEIQKNTYDESVTNFKSSILEKDLLCNHLQSSNDELKNEINKLNCSLENYKKLATDNSNQIQKEYSELKDQFKKQTQLLESKLTELESLQNLHKHVLGELALSKFMLNSSNENNMILSSEFKILLTNFNKLNLRYMLMGTENNDLKAKYDNILMSMEMLQKDYADKVKANEEYSAELLCLKEFVDNKTSVLSDLEAKCNSLDEQYKLQAAQFLCLKGEYDDLKAKYDNKIEELATLNSHHSLEKESNDKLAQELNGLEQSLSETKESLLNLKNVHESLILKHEETSFVYKQLQKDYSKLEETYQTTLSDLQKLTEICFDKDETSNTSEVGINQICNKMTEFKEEMYLIKNKYNEILDKYNTECSRVKMLEKDLLEIDNKYKEALTSIDQLERDYLLKTEANSKLEQEILKSDLQRNETNESMLNLKKEYEGIVSKFELQSSSLNSLKNEYSILKETYNETSSKLEELQKEFNDKIAIEDIYKMDIEALNGELSKLKGELDIMGNNHSSTLLKYESVSSELSSLRLNNEALEKVIRENNELYEETKRQEETTRTELNKILQDHAQLESKYSDLLFDYENTCSRLKLLEAGKEELNVKYENVLKTVEDLKSECSKHIEVNDKYSKELNVLNIEIGKNKEVLSLLEQEHNELAKKYDSECSKLQLLEGEFNSLTMKYEEALSNISRLEEERSTSLESDLHLREEFTKIDEQLKSINEKYLTLTGEHTSLTSKHEEECSKHQSLQNSFQKLQEKYDKILSDIKTIEDESLRQKEDNEKLREVVGGLEGQLNDERNKVFTLEVDYENLVLKHENDCSKVLSDLNLKYEEAIASLKESQEEYNQKKISNEELENQLKILKDENEVLSDKYSSLKAQCEILTQKFDNEVARSSLIQENFDVLQQKYNDTISSFNNLQEEYSVKMSENTVLLDKNNNMTRELATLSSALDITKEELNNLKENYEAIIQECSALKKELNNLQNEKSRYTNVEESNIELKNKCEELENNLRTKTNNVLDLEMQINELNQEKAELLQEKEELAKKHSDLAVFVEELSSSLQSSREAASSLEANLQAKHLELNEAVLKINKFQTFEDLISTYKKDYPLFSDRYNSVQEEFSVDDDSVFEIFFATVDKVLKDELANNEELIHLKSSLVEKEEEVEKLSSEIKSLTDNINSLEIKLVDINKDYTSLNEKYQLLQDSHDVLKAKSDALNEKMAQFTEVLKEKETFENNCLTLLKQNDELTNKIREITEKSLEYEEAQVKLLKLQADYAREIAEKDHLLSDMKTLQGKYESAVSENRKFTSQLTESSRENELLKVELSRSEQSTSKLKVELEQIVHELSLLRTENAGFKEESNKFKVLCNSANENAEKWGKENERLKADKLKYEKDYQNAIDSLRKTQEEMCNMQRNVDEKMARFTFVLKEKESFENKCLSLLKQNDDLTNRIRDITEKSKEYEKSQVKLLQLQSEYDIITKEKTLLETQLHNLDKFKRESTDIKAQLVVKDIQIKDLKVDNKQLKTNYQQKCNEMDEFISKISSILPGNESSTDIVKSLECHLKSLEDELKEEKNKCENLDEECNLLNDDLKYKEKVIGDMFKEHSEELEELRSSMKKTETECKQYSQENISLKDKIGELEAEVQKLKTTESGPCIGCMELKKTLHQFKVDLVERDSKVASLQQSLDDHQLSFKKKVYEYRKKVVSLQDELGTALNKLKSTEKSVSDGAAQTDPLLLQLTGHQGGIVQSAKIKEQEEKIKKFEKENSVLKKVCHNRLQTIKELQGRLENGGQGQTSSKKTIPSRGVLEEVQNK